MTDHLGDLYRQHVRLADESIRANKHRRRLADAALGLAAVIVLVVVATVWIQVALIP